ncbi:hypothetical protein OHB41_01315 [Streptomyces sp. NBC_01571]|uniref:hypothetical protein n=1 Tax=Streptomyces sp. NBC_01571 TaxID=2975883 RepID=UPI0022594C79|nr:hypothetical protein [Streptomyces sp. NBC_01571]MCX4571860.1 hypothetical protein [Streptomyces sp. NBC_01571]
MAVFATTDAPLRARAVCEAMDVEITPGNINNVRLNLKRLAERGILAETEPGCSPCRGRNPRRGHRASTRA